MSDVDKDRTIELVEYDNILSTKGGRNVMYRILQQTGVQVDGFNENPYIHARNAGKREDGLWLIDELKAASNEKYMTMLKEHIDD